MNLYFAYGSNMNEEQMRMRCPKSHLLGSAVLQDRRLAFTIFSSERGSGCADIVVDPASSVFGLLYELTAEDLEALDRFEGVPTYYRRIVVIVHKGDTAFPTYTYEVVEKQNDLKPSPEYLHTLQEAAKQHRFPMAYQMFLASFS